MLAAQYKISADIISTRTSQRNKSIIILRNAAIFLQARKSVGYIFDHVQIKHLSTAGRNVKENWNFWWNLWIWTDEKWHFGRHMSYVLIDKLNKWANVIMLASKPGWENVMSKPCYLINCLTVLLLAANLSNHTLTCHSDFCFWTNDELILLLICYQFRTQIETIKRSGATLLKLS